MIKLHTYFRQTILIGFLLFILPLGVLAEQWTSAADIEKSPRVQQALREGRITPQQLQEAIIAVKQGRLPPKVFLELQQEAARGTLTPAEIEAGRALLEQKKSDAAEEVGHGEKA